MGAEPQASNSPVPIGELTTIATEACDTTLESVQEYEHDKVSQWSSQIINQVLQSLIRTTQPSDEAKTEDVPASEPSKPAYRFNVTCTIIQQGVTTSTDGAASSPDAAGRRGMHCASGAYWDVERDGMWTYKYPNAEDKGMDLVLNVVWFGSSK